MRYALCILGAAMLAGCATQQQTPDDPIGWARFDCRRSNPALDTELEQAKQICINRAEAEGRTALGQMHDNGSLVMAVGNAINAGQIKDASGKACMAERGFTQQRQSEFDARCPIAAPPPIATPVPKRR